MQVQKDVLIAGGVVVVCVALVIVALVATGGKKETPSEPIASGPSDTYGSPAYGDPSSAYGSPGTPDPGSFTPTPAPDPGSGSYGSGDGPSAFAPSPLAPAPAPAPSYSDPGAFTPTPAPMPTPAPPAVVAPGGGTHTVAKGETLGDISATHYGTTKHWRKIVEANPGLDPARLKIGQVLQIPAVESAAAPVAAADGPDAYTVKKGESYYTIAKKQLGSSSRWREIERLNNIPAEELRAGQVIKLPPKADATATPGVPGAPGGKTHVVAKGETLGDISKLYFGTTTKWKQIVEANAGVRPENLKVGQSLAIPDLPAAAAPVGVAAPIGGSTYTVKSGDTLETIAASTLGKKSAWKQIVEANPGLDPTRLKIGQTIAIPGGTSSDPAPISGPTPGSFGPITPGTPAPAPAPPPPTFQDDPFYSPYDGQPAPASVR